MAQWREITKTEDWENLKKSFAEETCFILKHSTACPISAEAYRECESYLEAEDTGKAQYILVKVIESRPVSNQIAADLKIKHESPQAIILRNGNVVWHASHWSIKEKAIREILS